MANKELERDVSKIKKFSVKVMRADEQLEKTEGHLSQLDQVLNGKEVARFVQNELAPFLEDYEQGNVSRAELNQVLQDENVVEQQVEEMKQGLEDEVSELQELISYFRELANMCDDIERVLERMEQVETS